MQRSIDFPFLMKWIILTGILWPVGLYLNRLLVFILLYGLGPTGLYSTCESMIELHILTTPLLTSSPCLQRWIALEICWVGIIIGYSTGFVQWRILLRRLHLPKTWIDMNTIGWAIGGPLAYLLYMAYRRTFPVLFLPVQSPMLTEITIFTWVVIGSELVSGIGEQWVLGKHWHKARYWFVSNLLGSISAGVVAFSLSTWVPMIGYIGLLVGVTSGLALWYGTKNLTE